MDPLRNIFCCCCPNRYLNKLRILTRGETATWPDYESVTILFDTIFFELWFETCIWWIFDNRKLTWSILTYNFIREKSWKNYWNERNTSGNTSIYLSNNKIVDLSGTSLDPKPNLSGGKKEINLVSRFNRWIRSSRVIFPPPPFPRIRRNRARCEVMQVAFPPVVPGDWKSLLSLSQIAFLDCLVTSSYSGHLWTTPARGTNEEGSVKACIAKASSNYQRLQGSKQLFLYCVYWLLTTLAEGSFAYAEALDIQTYLNFLLPLFACINTKISFNPLREVVYARAKLS